MAVNRCINCGSRVFDDGFCGDVNCNSYYSQWDMTCAPAQEEKEMGFDVRCKKCDREHNAPSWDTKYCRECAKQATADLRERWDRAFYAALTGFCSDTVRRFPNGDLDFVNPVPEAESVANETIRRHAELTASRDKLIAEVVG